MRSKEELENALASAVSRVLECEEELKNAGGDEVRDAIWELHRSESECRLLRWILNEE